MRRLLAAVVAVAALVALVVYVVFAFYYEQPETPRTATGPTTAALTNLTTSTTAATVTNVTSGATTTVVTNVGGLPPFANPDFDVLVQPSIVTVPESGGSVSVLITLQATKMNTSEALAFETHSNIPRYEADFKPTSVALHPGGSASVELTVQVPSGILQGTYPMSVVARGETTQGGSWLIIGVGVAQPIPPP